jgi:Protein of unknown function (DUF445)
MRDPDHPWRDEANTLIENLIDDLAHDPEMGAQGEALKQEILANPVFAEQAQALHEELETALRDELPRHAEANVSGSDFRQRAQPIARRRRAGAARGSTGSDSWCYERSCHARQESPAISPRWLTIGT